MKAERYSCVLIASGACTICQVRVHIGINQTPLNRLEVCVYPRLQVCAEYLERHITALAVKKKRDIFFKSGKVMGTADHTKGMITITVVEIKRMA